MTDCDEIVARRVSWLERCSKRDGAYSWHAARPEDTKEGAREVDGVEKQ